MIAKSGYVCVTLIETYLHDRSNNKTYTMWTAARLMVGCVHEWRPKIHQRIAPRVRRVVAQRATFNHHTPPPPSGISRFASRIAHFAPTRQICVARERYCCCCCFGYDRARPFVLFKIVPLKRSDRRRSSHSFIYYGVSICARLWVCLFYHRILKHKSVKSLCANLFVPSPSLPN